MVDGEPQISEGDVGVQRSAKEGTVGEVDSPALTVAKCIRDAMDHYGMQADPDMTRIGVAEDGTTAVRVGIRDEGKGDFSVMYVGKTGSMDRLTVVDDVREDLEDREMVVYGYPVRNETQYNAGKSVEGFEITSGIYSDDHPRDAIIGLRQVTMAYTTSPGSGNIKSYSETVINNPSGKDRTELKPVALPSDELSKAYQQVGVEVRTPLRPKSPPSLPKR